MLTLLEHSAVMFINFTSVKVVQASYYCGLTGHRLHSLHCICTETYETYVKMQLYKL